MEGTNGSTSGSDWWDALQATIAANGPDWWDAVQPAFRLWIINGIVKALERPVPMDILEDFEEVCTTIVVELEEKIYTEATCLADYFTRISEEMVSMGLDPAGFVNWRVLLEPGVRQSTIYRIVETLLRFLPIHTPEGINELRKIAVRFEEKTYTEATCQADYSERISERMLLLV